MEWYDWIVLVLSLGFLAAFGTALWWDRPKLGPPAPPGTFDPNEPYRVYCRDFDVETDAESLDKALGLTPNSISVSEARLAEVEKDLASWRAQYESAVVDATARIRGATSKETHKDAVVSLLIDHSGSMRGKPMLLATRVVATATALLEPLGAKQEVLGFTTVRWRGGWSRQRWLENGRPSYPGRLSDILHIVYCHAGERPSAHHYAMMMRETVLKENVDGEAVEWAASRLRQRGESRKYLIVVSDGAPVDDSTLAVNPGTYLDHHLRGAIAEIAQAGDIQLAAIGLGHAVDRYYDRSVVIRTMEEDPGSVVLQLLEQLLGVPRADASNGPPDTGP